MRTIIAYPTLDVNTKVAKVKIFKMRGSKLEYSHTIWDGLGLIKRKRKNTPHSITYDDSVPNASQIIVKAECVLGTNYLDRYMPSKTVGKHGRAFRLNTCVPLFIVADSIDKSLTIYMGGKLQQVREVTWKSIAGVKIDNVNQFHPLSALGKSFISKFIKSLNSYAKDTSSRASSSSVSGNIKSKYSFNANRH